MGKVQTVKYFREIEARATERRFEQLTEQKMFEFELAHLLPDTIIRKTIEVIA